MNEDYQPDLTALQMEMAELKDLLMETAAQGECRLETPFATLIPILDEDGLRWCCTHNPSHCSEPVAALARR